VKRFMTSVAIAAVAASAAACTESKRANQAATFGDQAADITCWTYGTQIFSGRSTGKVEYATSGRISFVDASNERFTTIEGDCRVVYVNGDAEEEEAQSPLPPPPPPPPAEVPGKPMPDA
jgi:hypothetical protein